MKLNTLAPAPGAKFKKKRHGRGNKTCGRGMKGQKARNTVRAGFEGGQTALQRRLPKFGFTSRVSLLSREVRSSELNLVKGDEVTLQALADANVITDNIKRVKVMLSGDVTRALTVIESSTLKLTKGAKEAVVAAGGQVKTQGE